MHVCFMFVLDDNEKKRKENIDAKDHHYHYVWWQMIDEKNVHYFPNYDDDNRVMKWWLSNHHCTFWMIIKFLKWKNECIFWKGFFSVWICLLLFLIQFMWFSNIFLKKKVTLNLFFGLVFCLSGNVIIILLFAFVFLFLLFFLLLTPANERMKQKNNDLKRFFWIKV